MMFGIPESIHDAAMIRKHSSHVTWPWIVGIDNLQAAFVGPEFWHCISYSHHIFNYKRIFMGTATREMVGLPWVVWGGINRSGLPHGPMAHQSTHMFENLVGNSCPMLKELLSPSHLVRDAVPLGSFGRNSVYTLFHQYIYIYIYMSNRQNSRILRHVLAGHWLSENTTNCG